MLVLWLQSLPREA